MRCQNCGKNIGEVEKFCGNCSNAINKEDVPAHHPEQESSETGNSMSATKSFFVGLLEIVLVVAVFFISLFVITAFSKFLINSITINGLTYMDTHKELSGFGMLSLLGILSLLIATYSAKKVYKTFENKFGQRHSIKL